MTGDYSFLTNIMLIIPRVTKATAAMSIQPMRSPKIIAPLHMPTTGINRVESAARAAGDLETILNHAQ